MKAISELGFTYEEAKKFIGKNVCSCKGILNLAWGGFYGINEHVIICGTDKEHSEFIRPVKVYEPLDNIYKLKPKFIMKEIDRMVTENRIDQSQALVLKKFGALRELNRTEALEVLSSLYPGAPEVELTNLAYVCADYGLNPAMGHVRLIPFNVTDKDDQGKRLATSHKEWARVFEIKAKRLMCHRECPYSYLDMTPRVMTEAEQMKVYGKVWKDRICAITYVRDQKGNEAYGFGWWPAGVAVKGAEKGNSPEHMSGIRSESQALDRLHPPKTLSELQTMVYDERYMSVEDITPQGEIEAEVKPEITGTVDESTGEIVQGEAREIPQDQPAAQPAPTKEEYANGYCEIHKTPLKDFKTKDGRKFIAHTIPVNPKKDEKIEWCNGKPKTDPYANDDTFYEKLNTLVKTLNWNETQINKLLEDGYVNVKRIEQLSVKQREDLINKLEAEAQNKQEPLM